MAEPPAAARIPLLLQQHLHIVSGSSRSAGPNCHCAGPWKLSGSEVAREQRADQSFLVQLAADACLLSTALIQD